MIRLDRQRNREKWGVENYAHALELAVVCKQERKRKLLRSIQTQKFLELNIESCLTRHHSKLGYH